MLHSMIDLTNYSLAIEFEFYVNSSIIVTLYFDFHENHLLYCLLF